MALSSADRETKIKHLLTRNVEEVIERAHLEAALKSGKKLRVKHGIDPTGPKIHIGRGATLWKLREFQDLGHKIVLIVGDFTAQIGDPSDKVAKRPFLTRAQVKANLKGYLPQIGKIVDLKKAEIRYNSEWLAKLNLREASELAELFTFQQILERRNFRERWEKHQDISYREGMYALMQGYDSVMVKADVELGGSDQLFNLLAGRKVQAAYGQKPQDIMTTKMLVGTDGRKMSTSWGNVINIIDDPDEQYGKVMAMRDEQIVEYLMIATDLSPEAVRGYEKELKGGENPKVVKEKLAFEIVKRYHGEKAAANAAEEFRRLFSKGEMTENIPGISLDRNVSALDAALTTGIPESKSEARRLIEQGGFRVNGVSVKDPTAALRLKSGDVLKVGKRHFFHVV